MASLPRLCLQCQSPIPHARTTKARYCSWECQRLGQQVRYGNTALPGIPVGTVGAMGELVVITDLMRRGFDVYRAMSPSCPCDLVAIQHGQIHRIEVKTSPYLADGTLRVHALPLSQQGKSDIVAYVHKTSGEIRYVPELPGTAE